MNTREWVSCSKREFGPPGEYRHLIIIGQLTTLCGDTATYADIWRRDTRKPACVTCSSKAKLK